MAHQTQFEGMDAPEFAQRHYSVLELAELWNLGAKTVRSLFENEPGVVVIDAQNTRKFSKRHYRTLRIPKPIAERVYARLRKSA